MEPSLPPPTWPIPVTVLLWQKVTRVDDLIRVHVLFLLNVLFQIEKRLGSYTADSSTFIKEFWCIPQSHNLTFPDISMILTTSLLSEERRQAGEQASMHAEEVHQANAAHPVRFQATPDWDS